MTKEKDGMKYYFPGKTKEEIAEMQKTIDECYANVIKNKENVNDK